MTHKLATGENFDIVRGKQTVRVPFDATDPQTPTTVVMAKAAANPSAGNLAALDAGGNATDSQIPAANVATRPANPTANNLVKTTATGELQDAGYHFEVRNGIPCIVQYT